MLEVYAYGLWGSVCTGDFGSADAKVACSQLGFKRLSNQTDYWIETLQVSSRVRVRVRTRVRVKVRVKVNIRVRSG